MTKEEVRELDLDESDIEDLEDEIEDEDEDEESGYPIEPERDQPNYALMDPEEDE